MSNLDDLFILYCNSHFQSMPIHCDCIGLAWFQHLLELCHLSDGEIGCSVLTLL